MRYTGRIVAVDIARECVEGALFLGAEDGEAFVRRQLCRGHCVDEMLEASLGEPCFYVLPKARLVLVQNLYGLVEGLPACHDR